MDESGDGQRWVGDSIAGSALDILLPLCLNYMHDASYLSILYYCCAKFAYASDPFDQGIT